MKTIGVLGGMGPQATMEFERRVHEVSQKLIPQFFMTGYPPMVVSYFRHPPIVFGEDGLPVEPHQPEPRLFEAATKLGSVADFLVVTSNAPHMMQEHIEEAAGRKILSMIEQTLNEVKRRGVEKIGVLGLGEPEVYMEPLGKMGIAYEILPEELMNQLDDKIVELMEGKVTAESRQVARKAVDTLRERGCDAVILGCTEIPLLLGEDAEQDDLLNPLQLLAEAAVRHATS